MIDALTGLSGLSGLIEPGEDVFLIDDAGNFVVQDDGVSKIIAV